MLNKVSVDDGHWLMVDASQVATLGQVASVTKLYIGTSLNAGRGVA